MPRITPADAIEAYDGTTYTPKPGRYYGMHHCACPIGALFALLTGELPIVDDLAQRSNEAQDWAHETYGDEYTHGFTNGFDGPDNGAYTLHEAYEQNKPAEFLEGMRDGAAVYKALADRMQG